MNFVEVGKTSELETGQMKQISVGGKQLLLVNAEGEYFAVDEICSHEEFSLYYGCIKGKQIKCSLHGSYFDLSTGEALDEPADEPIGTYPVKVEHDSVYVSIEN